ncbi:uncharacterized protein MONBRDRAFT_30775 [Monosiga brevicollis MX1]|uniref:Pru domain-containing protein n=1 Tax=Monosiga brevicollis TaxID=81824 RepID=A9UP59_MONBE|nr:uncharacterized protein MONBRDRAFT_30775 [Monosiga brevicollis MX1]EDQ92817.1 predicted protein [Monosiga brevicollis MX1]|eukprot:XP_001742579.1 hypothetical protein [Monosiga brevicollis MX1]
MLQMLKLAPHEQQGFQWQSWHVTNIRPCCLAQTAAESFDLRTFEDTSTMSLFANSTPGGRGMARPANANLFEFKAGRMTQEGNTVTAVPGKGLVFLKRDGDLLMWHYKSRDSGREEEEPIVLFPGEQTFQLCKSAPASSRVYYLKFSGGRRDFFWMQSPDAAGDALICQRVNRLIDGGSIDEEGVNDHPMGVDASEEQQAIMQMLRDDVSTPGHASGAAQRPPAAPTRQRAQQRSGNAEAGGEDQPLSQDNMQGLVQNFAREMMVSQATSLTDVLSASNVEPLLDNPETVQRLLAHLPDGDNASVGNIRSTLRSPQYAQHEAPLQHGKKQSYARLHKENNNNKVCNALMHGPLRRPTSEDLVTHSDSNILSLFPHVTRELPDLHYDVVLHLSLSLSFVFRLFLSLFVLFRLSLSLSVLSLSYLHPLLLESVFLCELFEVSAFFPVSRRRTTGIILRGSRRTIRWHSANRFRFSYHCQKLH